MIMARLQLCDYHNMVAILEKSEHNVDFHPMVDFIEASPLRIETTEEETKILAIVDGILRTVTDSSLRRNLKLKDKEGISSLPDMKLFENLTLIGYNISPNQKFTFQKGQFSHQWKYLIHTIMQCLSPKSTGFNEFSSNIATALVCLATNRTYNFSKMIFDGLVKNVNKKISEFLMYPRFLTMCLRMSQFGQITHTQTYVVPFHTRKLFNTLRVNSPSFSGRIVPLFDSMLVHQGEGSSTPTESHHTPFPKAQHTLHTTHSSPPIPSVTTTPIPPATSSETTPIKQYTRRARIAQSSALPPVADEPASPLRNVSQGEAYPTESGFIADQDRATISKSSPLPHDSAPRVTSHATVQGSMQQIINELTTLCTSLQRQYSELVVKFEAQELEITRLKARVKLLEDREGVAAEGSGDDAPIKGRNLDEGEAASERASDDTEEMATILTSIDAATVLASGAAEVPTGSGPIPTAGSPTTEVPTGSDVVPTASPVFATATVVTPYRRRKGKEVMIESETPKKTESSRADRCPGCQRAGRATRERGSEKGQQRKPWTKKQKRDYDMAVIKSNLGWKVKDFKGMTFEEVEAKFNSVWKQIKDFIPIGSKEEAKRIKRKGLSLEQESAKKFKPSKEVNEEAKSPDEVPEDKIKEMMQLVPIEEVYVEALQVKHLIIDWKVHSEGQRAYWKITRLGGSSACYQFFIDLLKHLDREDLNQLSRLVKETLNNRPPTSDKEMELWVELSRLYEPDDEDQLWTHTQNLMYAPVEWKLYDSCGVHHVTAKDKKIFMLVEKDYPLKKGLALVMISYKLQVENYSRMAKDLILKIYKISSTPRQQGIEFPLAEEVPTASEEGCHCQKKREATAKKIALLSNSRRNC
nr:hypothetical protein [Tanacetum cinerariifolium]